MKGFYRDRIVVKKSWFGGETCRYEYVPITILGESYSMNLDSDVRSRLFLVEREDGSKLEAEESEIFLLPEKDKYGI